MNRIILTGASGMLGFYLVRRLLDAEFDNLVLLLRPESNTTLLETLALEKLEIIRTEIGYRDGCKGILAEGDVVIHAAATLGFGHSERYVFNVNHIWTRSIVDEALAAKAAGMIFVSSVAALNRMKEGPVSEEERFDFPDKAGPYALSKYKAEKEIWRGHAEGLPSIVFNPSQLIGLGHYDQLNSKMLHYFRKLWKYFPVGGLGIVDVRDVAEAIVRVLIVNNLWGQQFLLNAENLSYRTFINEARLRMQLPTLSSPLPLWVHRYGYPLFASYHWVNGEQNPFTRNYLRNLARKFEYDNSESLKIPDFKYRSWNETLDDWVKTFKQTKEKSFGILPR